MGMVMVLNTDRDWLRSTMPLATLNDDYDVNADRDSGCDGGNFDEVNDEGEHAMMAMVTIVVKVV